jgi:hypothetical protein
MEFLTLLAYVVSRYLHLVAAALIVGGTLFYLWVVPFAIAELKPESQQIVFARARLIFRRTVFVAAILLIISGAVIAGRGLWIYQGKQIPVLREAAMLSHPNSPPTHDLDHPDVFEKPALWFSLHVAASLLCLGIAIALVRGGRPPLAPITWMRINFALLLVTILLAVLTRNARQRLGDSVLKPLASPVPSEIHE